MNTPLQRLTIRGFKSIREMVDFELHPLNVLIGANGAGKSNFVEFFRLISAMTKRGGLREFVAGNADAFLFGGPKRTKAIVVKMTFGPTGYDFELAPTVDGFFLINNELHHTFSNGTTRDFGSGKFDPGALADTNGHVHPTRGTSGLNDRSGVVNRAICSCQVYHVHDTSFESGMRRYHDRAHGETLAGDAANIAPYLLNLNVNQPEVYAEIINAIRIVLPFFDDFILQPNAKEYVRLDWRQKGLADYPMRPTQLSDGALRFICLTTALLQPRPPATIIIDEPELGLHPDAVAVLSELIRHAAKRTQVIVSTQSPTLIDHFGVEEIVVVSRDDGGSTFERLKESDFQLWLEQYSVGELWTKNVIRKGPMRG